MRSFLSITFSIFTLFCYAQQESLPWISVSGNNFVDEAGKTIIFQALNTSDPDKLDKEGRWEEEYFEQIKSWNANMVRFPIHPKAWRERGNEAYLKLIDKGIKMAKERNMYVILDWHSIGNLKNELYQHPRYDTTIKETFKFWQTIANRYGNNSTVAMFELFNEPTLIRNRLGTCTWEEWKDINEEIITIIRATGARNIPLVAGFNWAYDLTEVINSPIDAEGIAYVSHPYPMKRERPWESKWEADFGHVADKYPVILTEIGYCGANARGAHVPVISDENYAHEITAYTHKKGISFCVWVFDPVWSPMLIEDWEYNLTPPGKVWKSIMLKNG